MLKTALGHKQWLITVRDSKGKITILHDEYCDLKTKTRSGDIKNKNPFWGHIRGHPTEGSQKASRRKKQESCILKGD